MCFCCGQSKLCEPARWGVLPLQRGGGWHCRGLAQAGRRDRGLLQLLAAASDKPQARQSSPGGGPAALQAHAEAVSFWAAGMLPLDGAKRLGLLEMVCSAERLRLVQGLLQASHGHGCALQ